MARFYSTHLGKTLKDAVDRVASEPVNRALTLYDEIEVSRATATQAIALAAAAFDSSKSNPAIRALACTTVHEALEHVSKLVARAARVESLAEDKLSLGTVDHFVSQVVSVVWDVLGEEHEDLAEAIDRGVRERVRIPLDGMRGRIEDSEAPLRQGVRLILTEEVDDDGEPEETRDVAAG